LVGFGRAPPPFISTHVFDTIVHDSDENKPEIISTDIETCNGVIHLVDAVMLYKTPEELGLPAGGDCETMGMYHTSGNWNGSCT
jgi:hypothetical protein